MSCVKFLEGFPNNLRNWWLNICIQVWKCRCFLSPGHLISWTTCSWRIFTFYFFYLDSLWISEVFRLWHDSSEKIRIIPFPRRLMLRLVFCLLFVYWRSRARWFGGIFEFVDKNKRPKVGQAQKTMTCKKADYNRFKNFSHKLISGNVCKNLIRIDHLLLLIWNSHHH